MMGAIDMFLLQLSSPNCLNITFCLVSHHLWTQQTIIFVSCHNLALTDMCIFLLKQVVSYYVSKDTPVFSATLKQSVIKI